MRIIAPHSQSSGLRLLLCTLVTLTAWNDSAPAQSTASSVSESEINALVAQLSDPNYSKRVGATRRLCAIGAPATEVLTRVAAGSDMEAALRAKKILQALDHVWFSGVEVVLESSRSAFEWREPVEVRMVLENRSGFPARIPFDTSTDQSEGGSADARQVAAMVDASDFLVVQNPQGKEIELRADEISDDPAVLRAVQARLAGGPSSRLAPGERAVIPLVSFNRGWARYPMLDEGDYAVAFRYVPEWIDPVLAEQHVGEVRSNALNLRITKAAPDTVSRRGGQPELILRREDDSLIAQLVNHSDRMVLINTNYGVSVPFADLQWIYERDGKRTLLPASPSQGRNWSDFDAGRLVSLDPGSSLVLVRIRIDDLVKSLGQAGESVFSNQATISASYFNLCDRQWQIREQPNLDKDASSPDLFRSPLPRQLLSARLTSQSVRPWSGP